MESKGEILVHMCCAPCAAPSGERLMLDGYDVILFFCNSNIHPKMEYDKRLESSVKLAGEWNIKIIEDEYSHESWLGTIKGLEAEPEKGERCKVCFDYSLQRTAEAAKKNNIPFFTTTLTLSPHKVSKIIFEIGKKYPGYLPFDFKKQNGFLRSLELTNLFNLYRQDYCGCEFSLAQRNKNKSI